MKSMSSRKKWTLLALLCIIQTAVPQTLSFKNWYAFSNATVTDADECGTIKKVVARMNNWSPAQFQILMDGVALGEENLVSKTTDVYFEGDGNGNPAWRVRMDNSGESWSYTFFINTRVTPYEIISTIPTAPFNSAKIESSKTVLTSPQEEFSLSGEGCSSADTATYAFQWVKSTDKKTWTDITNATTGQLESEKLSTDSMYYALKVRISYDEVDESGDTVKDAIHEVTSNIVLVSYQQPEVSFSASTGMNSPGDRNPFSGSIQRDSAS